MTRALDMQEQLARLCCSVLLIRFSEFVATTAGRRMQLLQSTCLPCSSCCCCSILLPVVTSSRVSVQSGPRFSSAAAASLWGSRVATPTVAMASICCVLHTGVVSLPLLSLSVYKSRCCCSRPVRSNSSSSRSAAAVAVVATRVAWKLLPS